MEAFALVEAISALASTGFSVARTIAKLVEDLKEADSQIAMIGIDTRAVAFVLDGLRSRLNEFPQSMSDVYREVVDVARDVVSVCRKEIEEIERTMKPLMPEPEAKSLTLRQKRRWLFAKSGVASRRASLDTLKLTLNLLLAGIDIKGHYGPPPLYLKERVTQLVEETKNTKIKFQIAAKTDKDAKKRYERSETHNRPGSRLAKPTATTAAPVLGEHKMEGVTTDRASLTEQKNAPNGRPPRVIVVSERGSTSDGASLSSASGEDEYDTELSQEDVSDDDDQMSAVTPWMPGEHWQSKIKEQLRVQKEVARFADSALVLYHNPSSNPFAPAAAGQQGNGSYPGGAYGGAWPSYGQPYPYQPQPYDPYSPYGLPPPPPQEPSPSTPKLNIRKGSRDPELLKMKEQLEQLQQERKEVEQARDLEELEQRVRQEAEERFKNRLDALHQAQEEARKEIELSRTAAEAAAMERLAEEHRAREERQQMEAEMRNQAAREERERIEAERKAEALRKYEQESLLRKAGTEGREFAMETFLLSSKAKDEEIRALSAKVDEALMKASLEEARMRQERESWLKERYELKEEALKARIDALNEVRSNYGTWISLRPQGSARIPFGIPPVPPGFAEVVRPSADRPSRPRAVSISSATVSSLASSVSSLGRFWRLKYGFKRRMKKLLFMKNEEDD